MRFDGVRRSGARLDGNRLPPVRVHRPRLRQTGRHLGLRAARHPRIDPDDLAAAPRGESRVENQYRRIVPWEGNLPALRAIGEAFELRPYFEWRGLGFISQSALKVSSAFAAWDAEVQFEVPGIRVTDPKAAQCGEVLKGVLKPPQCKLFGKECNPEHPIGALMVSSEGACAAYYRYVHLSEPVTGIARWRRSSAPRRACVSTILRSRWRTAPAARRRGGSSRGFSYRCSPTRSWRRSPMLRICDFKGSRIATTADGYVVKPLRFPGGSIGELAVNGTVNDLAVSGARAARAHGVASFSRPDCRRTTLRAEVEAMAAAAARAGVAIVGGDTKVVEHGFADGMYVTTFGFGEVDARAHLGPNRVVREGDRVLLSGPIGDHGITILLARGELDLEADLCSDTRSVAPFVEALLEAAAERPALDARSDARRRRDRAQRARRRDASSAITLFEEAIPLRDEVRGACEILGLDPLHIANEGQILAVVAARKRGCRARGDAGRARRRGLAV